MSTIYRYARHADDLADEGPMDADERLRRLDELGRRTAAAFAGEIQGDPLLDRLAAVVAQWQLPQQPFFDLLDAFTQDVTQTRYPDYATLLEYCRRSANPVGRLLLALYRVDDDRAREQSDAVCTALQLINFCQDVAIDWHKGRVYLPQDECRRHGIDPQDLPRASGSSSWAELMRFQRDRAAALLRRGEPLAERLGGRIGWELRLIAQGGLRILEKLDAVGNDVFRHRPVLRPWDWVRIGARAAGTWFRVP